MLEDCPVGEAKRTEMAIDMILGRVLSEALGRLLSMVQLTSLGYHHRGYDVESSLVTFWFWVLLTAIVPVSLDNVPHGDKGPSLFLETILLSSWSWRCKQMSLYPREGISDRLKI